MNSRKQAAKEYVEAAPTGSVERIVREFEMLGAAGMHQGRVPASTVRYLTRQLRAALKREASEPQKGELHTP